MSNFAIMTTEEMELYHHGVLGMKWGIRKDVRSALAQKSIDRDVSLNNAHRSAKAEYKSVKNSGSTNKVYKAKLKSDSALENRALNSGMNLVTSKKNKNIADARIAEGASVGKEYAKAFGKTLVTDVVATNAAAYGASMLGAAIGTAVGGPGVGYTAGIIAGAAVADGVRVGSTGYRIGRTVKSARR